MLLKLIAATLLLAAATQVGAQEVTYQLPRSTVIAGWQARLIRCPTLDAPKPDYVTQAVVASTAKPGELVRLNPNSPFLGSRKLALTYYENGMLKTINAEGEGKGGAVLATLAKTAAGFASFGVTGTLTTMLAANVPLGSKGVVSPIFEHKLKVACKSDILKKVARWQDVSDRIETIEAAVANGVALGSIRAEVLEQLKTEQAELEDALTLSTSVTLTQSRAKAKAIGAARPDGSYREAFDLPPINPTLWFDTAEREQIPDMNVGKGGFCARFIVSKAAFARSEPIETPSLKAWRAAYLKDGELTATKRLNHFVYFNPASVVVELWDNPTKAPCSLDSVIDDTLTRKTVSVAQFSDYFILPLGSGMFETKGSSAEFTAEGKMVAMGTNAVGGGSQFAEALAGGLAAAETMRDAKTGAIQRKIDRLKVEKELRELQEESSKNAVKSEGDLKDAN
ncbi:hypothetical protein SAMN05518849_11841 [Sphingobium sp. AP50]|uniref:hypothetical protein n=1 Tax=Sphingobium sp. AP50 TaxID=1884369 RepID=UPI0008C6F117|nr:hypothetical protein [Sphingobium sp. AP50]SEJ91789.1 hypothetical protein SAMN05518849_11841 [Sphingobium sp. AP50]